MYTYDNVIINPNKEDLKSLIGKEVYKKLSQITIWSLAK